MYRKDAEPEDSVVEEGVDMPERKVTVIPPENPEDVRKRDGADLNAMFNAQRFRRNEVRQAKRRSQSEDA